jgi:flagellar biosynthesis anti-sigma factor FlgM
LQENWTTVVGPVGSNKIKDMIQRGTPNAGDETRLPTASDTVDSLKARLRAVAEVRQHKVDGLRQAIETGTYEVLPQRIAAAMLADFGRKLV